MPELASLVFVFVAGFITALATGVGALPFFLFKDISARWEVVLWGLASGIMIAASVFGLLGKAYVASFDFRTVAVGFVTGIVLVAASKKLLSYTSTSPRIYTEADFKRLLLILSVLTVHSFPEGVAIGVSFAELNFTGFQFLGFTVPLLGVLMALAISIHNIPEGVAISIPLRALGQSKWQMVWWSVFSSLPQPIGAVIAFYFVRTAQQLLPFGYGFAAGAMIFLVLTEFVPEGLEHGQKLAGGGRKEVVWGFVAGLLVMVPLAVFSV